MTTTATDPRLTDPAYLIGACEASVGYCRTRLWSATKRLVRDPHSDRVAAQVAEADDMLAAAIDRLDHVRRAGRIPS